MLRRSSRSRSRGRAAPYQAGVTPSKSPGRSKKVDKLEKGSVSLPLERNMVFEEGDIVMARWPGSKLFYNAKVQFVRDDDNEYDVEYENGVVFTIAAKDVLKQSSGVIRKPLHSRKSKSKSRARSTGRSRKTNKSATEESATMGLIDSEADKKDSFTEEFEAVEAKVVMLSSKISNSSKISPEESLSEKLENYDEGNMNSKKTSISSRVSSIKSSPTPKISNKSIETEEIIVSKNASRSSRVSKKSSKSSIVSSKAVATGVSKVNGDLSENNTNVLSVSTRASHSSVVFDDSNKKDDLELELVDISDIVPEKNSSQSSKKQSISSRISGMIFGGAAGSETQEESARMSRSSKVSLEMAVTDGFSEDEDLPPSVSARASRSSIISGTANDKAEDDKPELTDINESLPAKRTSQASIKKSISSRISDLLYGKENGEKDTSSCSQKNTSVSESSKLSIQKEVETENLASSSLEKDINEEVEEVEARLSRSSKYSGKPIYKKVSISKTVDNTDTTEDSFVPRRSSRVSIKTSNNSKNIESSSSRAVRLDEYSEDELDGDEAGAVNPEYIGGNLEEKSKSTWNFEWIWTLFFMVLCPAILIFLHTLCTGDVCNLAIPKISINPIDYVDKDALLMVVGFSLVLRVFEFVCMGKLVQGYRMNGFQTLMLILAAVPTLVYHKVPLAFVSQKYFFLMSSCILLSYAHSLFAYLLCRFRSSSSSEDICSKGNTGNPLVDIFHGPAINPTFLGCNLKLQTFRFSMIGLALLNVCLVGESLMSTGQQYNPNPAMTIGACLQVLYAMDAMWFEEYYFYSHDSLYSGYGWSLISSYLTFPFLPTLITRYLVARQPLIGLLPLLGICLVNMLGYIIYRSSESQRCELAKTPDSPNLDHLTTLTSVQGKKLIVSGWWGLVRHPNYLGELLIQWSWVLPAASSLGLTELVPYYLPVVTTLMLLIRCIQINKRNKRKYGGAWDEYTKRVKSNIIPLIF